MSWELLKRFLESDVFNQNPFLSVSYLSCVAPLFSHLLSIFPHLPAVPSLSLSPSPSSFSLSPLCPSLFVTS